MFLYSLIQLFQYVGNVFIDFYSDFIVGHYTPAGHSFHMENQSEWKKFVGHYVIRMFVKIKCPPINALCVV